MDPQVYSTIHDLSCQQVMTKIVVEATVLTFSIKYFELSKLIF